MAKPERDPIEDLDERATLSYSSWSVMDEWTKPRPKDPECGKELQHGGNVELEKNILTH